MGGPIEVNYAAIQTAADEVNKAQRLLETKLEETQAEVKRLGSTWTGSAQEQYLQAQAKVDEAQAALAQVLAKTEVALNDARMRYEEGEKKIQGSFG